MEVRTVIAATSLSPAFPATCRRKSHVCSSYQNISFPVRSINLRFFPQASSRRLRVYGSAVTLDLVR
jgi:allantoicase